MKLYRGEIWAFIFFAREQGSNPFLLPVICNLVILLNLQVLFCSSATQGPKDLGGHDSISALPPLGEAGGHSEKQKYPLTTIWYHLEGTNLVKTQPWMFKSVEQKGGGPRLRFRQMMSTQPLTTQKTKFWEGKWLWACVCPSIKEFCSDF